ncbi:MAG: 4-diphosphocytidyl-2-C-methyl-D-erythritol kinase [Alphaproteobacteria bacterium ADurb.Bin438]|nr:MAG: 4-diphosphocytidyl-2-C-methyl-D-erythritol kinase [Alphaproteobacteria bacterium ADurb.Bin438]
MSFERVVKKAYSKINLYLHVTGKDEKGYHLLDSLFVFSDICDEVEIFKTDKDKIEFKVEGEFKQDVPEDDNNLVIKICHAVGVKSNLKIVLHKNLPVSSGIGGGSADAGATLRGLVELFDLKFSNEEIIEIAKSIGADIPACYFSQSSIVNGIGEKITNFPLRKKYKILLINSLIKILTKDIFKIGVKNFSQKANLKGEDLILELKATKNDLLAPALTLVPLLNDILYDLKNIKGCLYSNMSGSGATCFALFENDCDLQKAYDTLKNKYENYWIKSGNIV